MKKIWIVALLVSLGLNLGFGYRLWRQRSHTPPDSLARTGGRVPGHMRADKPDSVWRKNLFERRLQHMETALGLRPEQAAALREIERSCGNSIRRGGDQVESLRESVRVMLAESSADTTLVRATLHKMGRRQAELDSLVTETIMREMGVLDPSQRNAYLNMLPLGRRHFRMSGRGPRDRQGR